MSSREEVRDMTKTVNVWEYEVEPRPHRIAWWLVRPLVAILFLTIVGIPLGLIFAAGATKAWQEHKAWKELKKA